MRRLRAAQLSAPEALAEDLSAPSLERVDAFLDRLVELPLASWLAVGESVVADRERLPVRQRAWDELEAKLVHGQLGMTIWSVRDAVDTAAYIACHESHGWSRREREVFAAAHGAAEAAALALLARDHLSKETYRALTAAFTPWLVFAESTHLS